MFAEDYGAWQVVVEIHLARRDLCHRLLLSGLLKRLPGYLPSSLCRCTGRISRPRECSQTCVTPGVVGQIFMHCLWATS